VGVGPALRCASDGLAAAGRPSRNVDHRIDQAGFHRRQAEISHSSALNTQSTAGKGKSNSCSRRNRTEGDAGRATLRRLSEVEVCAKEVGHQPHQPVEHDFEHRQGARRTPIAESDDRANGRKCSSRLTSPAEKTEAGCRFPSCDRHPLAARHFFPPPEVTAAVFDHGSPLQRHGCRRFRLAAAALRSLRRILGIQGEAFPFALRMASWST